MALTRFYQASIECKVDVLEPGLGTCQLLTAANTD